MNREPPLVSGRQCGQRSEAGEGIVNDCARQQTS
jgi:hypothetical protein